MNDNSISNFGLLIAYILPGLLALGGGSLLSPSLSFSLTPHATQAPTLGGFLYTTIASVGAGLTASTIRWLLIDPLHHATGIKRPRLDFSRLDDRVEAFNFLNENQYRYYQFYANSIISGTFAYTAWKYGQDGEITFGWTDVAYAALLVVFYAASRDTLSKYYARLKHLLGEGEAPLILPGV